MKRKISVCFLPVCLLALFTLAFAYTPDGTEKRPYQTTAQISDGLYKAVLQGKTEVTFWFDSSLYDSIAKNMDDILLKARIVSAGWQFTNRKCTVYGIDAYPDMIFCSSQQDIEKAFARGGSEVVLAMDKALFQSMSANRFAQLYKLEGGAGILNRSMSYWDKSGVVVYSDIEYADNFVRCETYEQLKRCIVEYTGKRADAITVYASDELYKRIKKSHKDYQDIFSDCAVLNADYYTYDSKNLLSVEEIDYYPGADVAYAHKNGRTYMLPEPERQLYELAKEIADRIYPEAVKADNYENYVIEALTREITECVVYRKNGDYYNDTAVGALLYGRCDCDGYADTFYLLGSLMGLDVSFQTGDSRPVNSDSAHMWNLIKINGKWYTHDVTWCDREDKEAPGRINMGWCGLGYDLASRYYIWNENAAVYDISPDSEAFDGVFWYKCESEDAVIRALSAGKDRLYLHLNEKLYNSLSANRFRNYYRLEAKAGIQDSMLYSVKNLVSVYDIVYAPVFAYCETEQDILNAFSLKSGQISVCMSESLYRQVSANNFKLLYSLESDSGILKRSMYYYDTKMLFVYNDIEYR